MFPPKEQAGYTTSDIYMKFLHHCVCVSQVTEISMGEFLMHSSVMWLNPLPSLGRMKKEPELTVFGE